MSHISRKPPPPEQAKVEGQNLRGALAAECSSDTDHFTRDTTHLLKHHGVYQQDHRDHRAAGFKAYSCFVRTRLPGGVMSADQFLCEVDLCERHGNNTIRITDRQGIQIHGVAKRDLQSVIRSVTNAKLTTWGACGDLLRNVMCCPAPINDHVRHEMLRLARLVSGAFEPQSRAYWELWIRDGDESEKVAEGTDAEEPFYGRAYLPRKFKIGFALPEDNCIDVLTHDLGFVAVVEKDRLQGFNAYVGGGMGVTPARKDTFAAVAQPLCFVRSGEVLQLARSVVGIHRDFGNRTDRKLARLRYLIADWGISKFFAHVERRMGGGLNLPAEQTIRGVSDHLGWHQDGSGNYFLGLHIPNGRIADSNTMQLKSGLARVAARFRPEFRITPHQNLLLCGILPQDRDALSAELSGYGIHHTPPALPFLREAMACPALPTCGLAITESERAMPAVADSIARVLRRHGVDGERLSVRMTGCPNGCTRPYVAEVGIVGKAKDRYSLFLGGSRMGTRIGFVYRDLVPLADLPDTLEPVIALYVAERRPNESFGDFCHRAGRDYLLTNAVSPLP